MAVNRQHFLTMVRELVSGRDPDSVRAEAASLPFPGMATRFEPGPGDYWTQTTVLFALAAYLLEVEDIARMAQRGPK